ncbi:MAG: alpha/beta fold hydrolase [Aureliella sp.]
METHAARLRRDLQQLAQRSEVSRIHIVAHSMGSLVVRQALLEGQLEKLKRIILLCPPNRGSHVATRWQRLASRLCKTLVQLSDQPEGFAARLAPTLAERYEVAIVAAKTDFVVRLNSTYLPGASQHTIVPGFHSSMLFSRSTADLTLQFIRGGSRDSAPHS